MLCLVDGRSETRLDIEKLPATPHRSFSRVRFNSGMAKSHFGEEDRDQEYQSSRKNPLSAAIVPSSLKIPDVNVLDLLVCAVCRVYFRFFSPVLTGNRAAAQRLLSMNCVVHWRSLEIKAVFGSHPEKVDGDPCQRLG